jgi:hypothetical protein
VRTSGFLGFLFRASGLPFLHTSTLPGHQLSTKSLLGCCLLGIRASGVLDLCLGNLQRLHGGSLLKLLTSGSLGICVLSLGL